MNSTSALTWKGQFACGGESRRDRFRCPWGDSAPSALASILDRADKFLSKLDETKIRSACPDARRGTGVETEWLGLPPARTRRRAGYFDSGSRGSEPLGVMVTNFNIVPFLSNYHNYKLEHFLCRKTNLLRSISSTCFVPTSFYSLDNVVT